MSVPIVSRHDSVDSLLEKLNKVCETGPLRPEGERVQHPKRQLFNSCWALVESESYSACTDRPASTVRLTVPSEMLDTSKDPNRKSSELKAGAGKEQRLFCASFSFEYPFDQSRIQDRCHVGLYHCSCRRPAACEPMLWCDSSQSCWIPFSKVLVTEQKQTFLDMY